MAVFTEVAFDAAARFVEPLGVGALRTLQGIAGGIENTNYFVGTERGEYVLTLFERLSAAQLPYYLRLMQHLARKGLPVPEPQADVHGEIVFALAGKPAALVQKLTGSPQLAPDVHHCEQLGTLLARMHLAGADFPLAQPNLRGPAWWQATAPQVAPFLDEARRALLAEELAWQQAAAPAHEALPQGPVHGDLFRDNALFDGLPGREMLCGVFDFYFAGTDALLYDVAVCLNDWCIDLATGRLEEQRAEALVRAYAAVRPLAGPEQRAMPVLLRAAALRFWLSRLSDLHLPRAATLLAPHDPGHFERVLRARVAEPWHPPL